MGNVEIPFFFVFIFQSLSILKMAWTVSTKNIYVLRLHIEFLINITHKLYFQVFLLNRNPKRPYKTLYDAVDKKKIRQLMSKKCSRNEINYRLDKTEFNKNSSNDS